MQHERRAARPDEDGVRVCRERWCWRVHACLLQGSVHEAPAGSDGGVKRQRNGRRGISKGLGLFGRNILQVSGTNGRARIGSLAGISFLFVFYLLFEYDETRCYEFHDGEGKERKIRSTVLLQL